MSSSQDLDIRIVTLIQPFAEGGLIQASRPEVYKLKKVEKRFIIRPYTNRKTHHEHRKFFRHHLRWIVVPN